MSCVSTRRCQALFVSGNVTLWNTNWTKTNHSLIDKFLAPKSYGSETLFAEQFGCKRLRRARDNTGGQNPPPFQRSPRREGLPLAASNMPSEQGISGSGSGPAVWSTRRARSPHHFPRHHPSNTFTATSEKCLAGKRAAGLRLLFRHLRCGRLGWWISGEFETGQKRVKNGSETRRNGSKTGQKQAKNLILTRFCPISGFRPDFDPISTRVINGCASWRDCEIRVVVCPGGLHGTGQPCIVNTIVRHQFGNVWSCGSSAGVEAGKNLCPNLAKVRKLASVTRVTLKT